MTTPARPIDWTQAADADGGGYPPHGPTARRLAELVEVARRDGWVGCLVVYVRDDGMIGYERVGGGNRMALAGYALHAAHELTRS